MKFSKVALFALLFVAILIQLPNDVHGKPQRSRGSKPREPKLIVPKTALGFWNSDEVQGGNNCYNYATNRRTDNFAQPGEASGQRYDELTCESVLKAASKDLGLVPTNAFAIGRSNRTLIALVVAPGSDFHWYRRDSSGRWTHKPGATPATIKDNSGKEISDPKTADRGAYSDFCGYFTVKNYAYRKDLQNGGYVRIGSMKSLPALPGKKRSLLFAATADQSEAEVLIYSGRKNPRAPLRALLADAKIGAALRDWATRQIAENALGRGQAASRLGYNGVAIRDSEGLILAQGAVAVLPAFDTFQASPEMLISQLPWQDENERLSDAIRDFVISRQ